jgi:DNA-binding Lrp family transcriptional regulator
MFNLAEFKLGLVRGVWLVRVSTKKKMTALFGELLKDSSRSDRDLGRVLGVSQPTVSRLKKLLVEMGFIRAFTVMPNFFELGYELMALTFVRMKSILGSAEEHQKGYEMGKRWMDGQPNVVFASYCRGMGVDAFMISLHKSYSEFDRFMLKHNEELGYRLKDVKNVLVSLDEDQIVKDLDFRCLVETPKKGD